MFHFSSPSSAVCVKVEGFTPNFHTVTTVKLKLKKTPKTWCILQFLILRSPLGSIQISSDLFSLAQVLPEMQVVV